MFYYYLRFFYKFILAIGQLMTLSRMRTRRDYSCIASTACTIISILH